MSNRKSKERRRAIQAEAERKQYMIDHPEECFCDNPEIDWIQDTPIRETEPIDGYPYPNSKGFTQPVYRCKKCRKEKILQIAFA